MWPTSAGLIAGAVLDRLIPDPRRGHPVAVFGSAAARLEQVLYRPSRARGALFTALAVGTAAGLGAGLGAAVERAAGPTGRAAAASATAAATAGATWAALGGAMLAREAEAIADALESGDLDEARRRLPGLCGRDPSVLDEKGIARATVESVAENTSDAVVGPLVWGALLGLPGLLGYRAANTLDAMVGHRSERYERFGAASARLDDVANWAPSRLTALLACAAAPLVGGSPRRALRVTARDGDRHPSPNSGRCEAAFAGALDLRLGGTNRYGDRVEHRPELGEGRHPEAADIRRAVALARAVDAGAAAVAAAVAVLPALPALPGGRR
ncbi:cobalamin biosynthesis protein [Nocardiopsis sp. RSe5-2]|uniref:Cobalamin biosynthesis protein CobD n=1 Tax=Nocardiopsis endophytica TaxID=3018445 RepID=A0ABT4U1H4_9ACTN|nr:cobalamin biosynthesis protein [Nocardiopsis endophytica]MDA2810531.1 cobalamin biosynthesis protein [Nocardiopsis endophytica]